MNDKIYYCGLVKYEYDNKFKWDIVKDVDYLSCEIFEFFKIIAQNKKEVLKILLSKEDINKKYYLSDEEFYKALCKKSKWTDSCRGTLDTKHASRI